MTYEKWMLNCFLALLVWIPLPMGSNRPWAVVIMEIWIYVLALGWLWGYSMQKCDVSMVFLKTRPVLLLLLIWLVYAATQLMPLPVSVMGEFSPESVKMHALAQQSGWITLSVDTHATIDAWLKSLAYVLVFCLALLLVNTGKRLEMLAYALVFSGLFQAFYGAFMTLSGLEYGFFFRKYTYLANATGTFINRNHLAGYLEMCLAVGIGLLISGMKSSIAHTRRQRMRNLLRLMLSSRLRLRLYLAVMVIALVLTHSRMGNSAFFSSMIAAGIIGLLLSKYATRATVTLLASLIVIDIFIVGTWFGVEKVVTRLENTSAVHDAGRIDVDENALKQWRAYLLTGSGGGSFYSVFPRYRTGDIASYYDHAHDDYIENASEYGIIGIILLGATVLASFIASILAQYRRRNSLMRGMAFSSTMGIIALMIHSCVDFNLQIPANSATFVVILALAWISLHLDKGIDYNRI